MFNIFISLSLILNMININVDYCNIEKIEYYSNQYENNFITLNIGVKTNKRDVVQLDVYFYNKDNELLTNKYYSTSLVIDGKKETRAKIPLVVEGNINLNMVFYSGNLETEIENVMFPIYPREFLSCNLNESLICESNSPVYVLYENKNIKEVKEKIDILNEDLNFNSFNNLVPVNKVKLISTYQCLNHIAVLKLNEKIDGYDIYYDSEYSFPLKISCYNGILSFEVGEMYYVDFVNGKVSENYNYGSKYTNEILLPYENKNYLFRIEMENCFYNFDFVVFEFYVQTKGNLIGKCNESKYCLRRNYL